VTTLGLSFVDMKTHTLPNKFVAAALIGQLVLITVFLVVADSNGFTARVGLVVLGSAGMVLVYLLVQLASRGKFGLGDVKFSAQFGSVGGFLGLDAWLWMMLTPFVLAGAFALLMLATKKMSLSDHLAFGPFMTLGGLLVSLNAVGALIENAT